MTSHVSPDRQAIAKKIAQIVGYLSKGQNDQALAEFDQLPRDIGNDEDLVQSYAAIAYNLGHKALAIEYFSRLVSLFPNNINYLDQLATVYLESGRQAEARHLLQRALAINPDFPSSLMNLGKVYVDNQDHYAAREVLERALLHAPNDSTLLCNLAITYNFLGLPEKAMDCALKASRLAPGAPVINRIIATLKLQRGDVDEAVKHYKKEIRINKFSGVCYWGIASAKKASAEDMALIEEMENLLAEGMPAIERGFIHFAAGKMYDDLQLWDKAFDHYRKGNLLRKQSHKALPPRKFVNLIQKTCSPRLKHLKTTSGSSTELPIFILGMPRTGSTLTEQIISSSPGIASAGEMYFMNRLTEQIFLPLNKPSAAIDAQLTPDALQQHTNAYLEALRSNHREQALHIIDKTPGNFHYIGLLLMMFPNARIIHTIRHPLDTLLSCYFQPFAEVPWAQDLETLAEAYGFYRESISYWQKILPADRILDVHYENLIAHPEEESRRIMQYCQLEWRPDCLQFFKNTGSVRTASTWQVRQPIYQSSKMRWLHYAGHVKKLAQDIYPYLTPEDLSLLAERGITLSPPGFLTRIRHRLGK